ncbi:MAG: DUF3987 domain-containing protein [Bacteroidaceae bacterium]|nr:DUF3987 domain-containing protein [Bacteroidaceae bacterium]
MNENLINSQVEGVVPSPADVPCNSVDGTQFTLSTLSSPDSFEEEEVENEDTDGDNSADLPVFPDEVYVDLSEPLASAVEHGRNPHDQMMLLVSSLVSLSATMTKKVGIRYSRLYRPNLMAFIIGSPASGKGRLSLAPKLVGQIHKVLSEQSQLSFSIYQDNLAIWKKESGSGDPPIRPKRQVMLLPANSTLAALDSLMADNDGGGLMFTADGGNMMTCIGSEYGNYINDLLATAENEGLSRARKGNDEFVEIPQVCFSVLVASTWSQIGKLFGDGNDGLFSRPIFLNMPKSIKWQSQWQDDDEETDEEAFDRLGVEFKPLYDRLCQLEDILFKLTKSQKNRLDKAFEQFVQSFVPLYGNDFMPTVRRMAVTALRIMCVITVLRHLNIPDPIPQVIFCSDQDFNRVIMMADILLRHAGLRSHYLAKTNSNAAPKPWLVLLNALPHKFKRAQAVEKGKLLCLAEQRVDKYIARLCNKDIKLRRVMQGYYEKI